ncbi:17-beta-hydroxysteroid dehydrogenase type 2 isoform X2 [Desmodus rotundus]|uniref:17-beta-hydroxysteroid dehydrogenase type 2 isoform X2 n=1 Tax=Desmodus rotundus TaxID=9430 RepID=UPI0023813764|nr:17-beta-hydroxysteroid dehydrogenase type 2 isoform X2 [Desmodus rotundus]
MSTLPSETAWLCLAVTAALGGLILCQLKKSPGQVGRKVVCLVGLWGGACLLSLSLFWGLVLFSLSCFLLHIYLSGQEMLPVDQKAVLITGSDSGIGHALSKYLDQLGFTVFAGVLDENGSGAEQLRRTCSKRLCVLQLDVTNPQQIKDAYSAVVQKVQNRGGIPFLKLAAYGSSKAALTMFSAIMRQELSKWEVKVSIIQPGGFKTNITGTSEMLEKLEKDMLDHLPPDVQEEYGQDYILEQRKILTSLSVYSSSDMSPVLQDIRHAISAKSPFTLYTPGPGTYLWLCFFSFSPTGIFDYFNKKFLNFDVSMPRTLSMPNWKNEVM